MRLELRCVLLSLFFSFFRIDGIFFLFNRVAILINLLFLRCRLFRCDKEDLKGCLVTEWVAIKDITSVLAIVLTESPAEGLAHD